IGRSRLNGRLTWRESRSSRTSRTTREPLPSHHTWARRSGGRGRLGTAGKSRRHARPRRHATRTWPAATTPDLHRPVAPVRERFGGTILHSCEYRSGEMYRGKRVLVVGAGNTGGEIAIDLHEHGASVVDLCVRGPIHVVRRDVFGLPAQVMAILTSWIPVAVL